MYITLIKQQSSRFSIAYWTKNNSNLLDIARPNRSWLACRLSFLSATGKLLPIVVGSGGLMVRAPACRSRGRRFEAWAISFTPLCLCLSEETLKAVGPNSCVSSRLGCLEYNYLRLEAYTPIMYVNRSPNQTQFRSRPRSRLATTNSAKSGRQYSSVWVTSGRHINIMDLH